MIVFNITTKKKNSSSHLEKPVLVSSMKKEYAKNLAGLFRLFINGWISLFEFLLMSTLNSNDKLMCASMVTMWITLIFNIAIICHEVLKVSWLDLKML